MFLAARDAEKRGAKVKKVLEIDPLHADTIRLMVDCSTPKDTAARRKLPQLEAATT